MVPELWLSSWIVLLGRIACTKYWLATNVEVLQPKYTRICQVIAVWPLQIKLLLKHFALLCFVCKRDFQISESFLTQLQMLLTLSSLFYFFKVWTTSLLSSLFFNLILSENSDVMLWNCCLDYYLSVHVPSLFSIFPTLYLLLLKWFVLFKTMLTQSYSDYFVNPSKLNSSYVGLCIFNGKGVLGSLRTS